MDKVLAAADESQVKQDGEDEDAKDDDQPPQDESREEDGRRPMAVETPDAKTEASSKVKDDDAKSVTEDYNQDAKPRALSSSNGSV